MHFQKESGTMCCVALGRRHSGWESATVQLQDYRKCTNAILQTWNRNRNFKRKYLKCRKVWLLCSTKKCDFILKTTRAGDVFPAKTSEANKWN